MRIYRTAEMAAMVGVHPNTVRLYEEWGLIPAPERQPNGYRVFTDFHLEQLKLVRLAFQIEVVQNGLRKKITQLVKTAAMGDFDRALALTEEYLLQVRLESENAEDAAALVGQILSGGEQQSAHFLKRREASRYLGISMDTLRNWEMNGLLAVKRKENGYRVYTDDDIRRLKIIRALRCASYSLEAILHMLCRLSRNPDADIRGALNSPKEGADIITACDNLITSLSCAEANARELLTMLQRMKTKFS